MKLTDILKDPQKALDTLIQQNPVILEYAEWVQYVPQGGMPPDDFTDLLKLVTRKGDEIVVAAKVKEPYKSIADVLAAGW